MGLNEQRMDAVLAVLKDAGAQRVLDLGCGKGQLLQLLLQDSSFSEIVGVDASDHALEVAAFRLRLKELPPEQSRRIRLLHGALTRRDQRLVGYDAAALVEVLEHLDTAQLAALERVVFEFARPHLVVCTTPNAEYNALMANLPDGQLRDRNHRFEFTRAEFQRWAERVAGRYGYSVRFRPVGPEDSTLGAPTQMAVFTR